MKKIKQFAMKKIADDYILIPRYETAEEMSDVITLSETAAHLWSGVCLWKSVWVLPAP